MSRDDLRPSDWDSYIGQENLKRRLKIHTLAALKENRMLEPTLLAAGPGMGKTSLAQLIAQTLREELMVLTMPVSATRLQSIIRMFQGVICLDEVHRLAKKQQEDLLPLLEFGHLEIGGRRIENPFLTIIACTTEPEALIEPLRDRFVIKPSYEEYSDSEMSRILQQMIGRVYDGPLPEGLAKDLADAAMGTPRRCRQFALAIRDLNSIGESITLDAVLDLCDIAKDGLTKDHLSYLQTLADLGGAKGLDIIVNLLGVTKKQVTQIERTLLKGGFIEIHNSRELTRKGVMRLREDK